MPGRDAALVVGRGSDVSGVRVDGGDDTPQVGAVRAEARSISSVPVLVPADAGIAIVGPRRLAEAVTRALVLQLCLNAPPGRVRVTDTFGHWTRGLPHVEASSGMCVGMDGGAGASSSALDVRFALVDIDGAPPPSCAAVLTLSSPTRARLTFGDRSQEVEVEAVSEAQAGEIIALLAQRAAETGGPREEPVPPLRELLPRPDPAGSGLPAVIGVDGVIGGGGAGPVGVDLVRDGPHAIVIGVTGSGKSELLTTWVASLAATHPPDKVSFLLVDFKGGRTFDALLPLPHVTGVLTDLDEVAALRAIESLRAEVRYRESALAARGARDIGEASDALSRLVVVVDEYAALVATHPRLHELFADLAARGRALGIHLVLASQRAGGVFREAVLSNAPLRLSLRVTDPADSRAVLGVDDAASLSGRAEDAGRCLVRGGGDSLPRPVRIARCTPAEVIALAVDGAPARKPWLAPLAEHIGFGRAHASLDLLALGVGDDPERQRQPLVTIGEGEPGLVVLGAAGSGKSAVLRLLSRQATDVVAIDTDPELGWDAVARAEAAHPGTLIIADDLDVLLARYPHDYSAVLGERLERLAREARSRRLKVIVSAQRSTGAIARIADSIPRRLLLTQASRADHVAAGGSADDFARLPPGRGRLDGVLVQTLWTDVVARTEPPPPLPWQPGRHPVAFVAPAARRTREVLEIWRANGLDALAVDAPDAALRSGRVVWGTPESWLAHWRLLAAARSDATLVIDAGCSAEYRALTGTRELPPYAQPHSGRAWRWSSTGAVRVLLPS